MPKPARRSFATGSNVASRQLKPSRSRAPVACEVCTPRDRDVASAPPPTLSFTLTWPPSTNAVWRPIITDTGAPRLVRAKRATHWRDHAAVELALQRVLRRGIAVPVAITVRCYPPHDHRRHDVDNVWKALLDVLTRFHVLADDQHIAEQHLTRELPDGDGRLEITLHPTGQS